MKKTIILTEVDIDTLASGGEVTFGNENNIEIHVVTEATHNRRKDIEELRDILIRCGAVSVTNGVRKMDIQGIPWGGYLCRDHESLVTVDFNKLAKAAYDHLMGE